MYSQIVQHIVDTLEENILSEWQLEQYAKKLVTRSFI